MLALWVPVTSHCALELVPMFDFMQLCCGQSATSQPHQDGSGDGDACSGLESGNFRIEEDDASLVESHRSLVLQTLAVLALACRTLEAPDASSPASPAPEPARVLQKSWRFLHRAALSPRAPSSASLS